MADLGRQVKYGIGKESVAGTEVAASYWLNQLEFSLDPKSEYVSNKSAYGNIFRTNSATVLRQWAEGSLNGKLTSNTGGLILLGAFGSVVTSDNADANASVKDHTFSINEDIRGVPFTFIRKDSLTTEAFTAGRFGQWELSMELDDYIKYTANVMARKGTTTTATPAFTSETEFVPKHMSVKTATALAGLAGATATSTVQSFTLTVNPNLEIDWESGNGAPASFTSRGFEATFEMTCRYNDTTYKEAYLNGTNQALQITALNTDVTIGTSANPKLVITASKMNITDWTLSGDLDSPLEQTMTGTIHFDTAQSKALSAVLTNTVASY